MVPFSYLATEWALASCSSSQHVCVLVRGSVIVIAFTGCVGLRGMVKGLVQHPVHCKCSINVLAVIGTFMGSWAAKGRRGLEAGRDHRGSSQVRGREFQVCKWRRKTVLVRRWWKSWGGRKQL